jgi:hypothetical protein
MSRRPLGPFALLAALAATAGTASRATAEDAPPAPAPAAPAATYKNDALGFSIEGPPGWKLVEGGVAPQWTTLATFSDAASASTLLVLVRNAHAVTLGKLRAEVTKTFADDKSFAVNSITDLPYSLKRPLPGLVVDATQTRPAEPVPGAPPPATPPPPVAWRLQAVYLLGGEREYLVLAQAKSAIYARFQQAIDRAIQGIALKAGSSAFTARGDGAFRDDVAGFSCRYPQGYGVRLPDRTQHLVEFAPAANGPVLGVFRYETDATLEREAELLLEYYRGPEVGGEATSGSAQVSGREAAVVTAKGRVGGIDQAFFVAVVKRGNDTFRLRVASDVTQETAAKATFDAFLKSFVLTN